MSNERRDRYVSAIFCADDGGVGEESLHLVMAVADAEQAELRAKVERVEAAIETARRDVGLPTPAWLLISAALADDSDSAVEG